MKIVLDTNVLVSAVLNPLGKPALILKKVREGSLQLLISEEMVTEIKEVFLYPHIQKRLHCLQTPEQIEDFLGELLMFAEVTTGKYKVEVVSADADDNKFLECALEGQADLIVSGDQHLKDLKIFQGIEIISPDELLKNLRP
jgi:putative PIN family toxin of toxin-antitoxin system